MAKKIDTNDCAVTATIDLIAGRWKLTILHVLLRHDRRFGEILVRIPAISRKVLTQQLRELEADGLISRKQYKERPPRVEYALTGFGHNLCPLLARMADLKNGVS
ncbi:winged helix-turn-helix transcriptional regulator [Spirosoma rhododendri]|uniref:Helix-turn-helix transcriptional regulator n=1 Tax=Spirosoma rhododendri TaxID=2728024 RepID=A0A7L5DLR0_9BACT|nr:helix-turn-helix domain-containing protein [Spirosoma rhododendri]QJD79414.1 helix-turn-helix transcriptional regulator [Spirosoma rhododendri]